MRRLLILVLALSMISMFGAVPIGAAEKFDVQIDTFDVPEPPAPTGTFTVSGEGADLLCPTGTWESTPGTFWNESDTGFKLRMDRVFTCDDTEEMFVLELSGEIIFGQGCVDCTWKLKDSTGFDFAPKGQGDIVALSALGESYVGSIKAGG